MKKRKPTLPKNVIPRIDLDFDKSDFDQLSSKEFEKSDAYKKYVLSALEDENKRKKQKRLTWWKNNWIQFFGLVFAFIAALPVIFQAICYILRCIA